MRAHQETSRNEPSKWLWTKRAGGSRPSLCTGTERMEGDELASWAWIREWRERTRPAGVDQKSSEQPKKETSLMTSNIRQHCQTVTDVSASSDVSTRNVHTSIYAGSPLYEPRKTRGFLPLPRISSQWHRYTTTRSVCLAKQVTLA